MNMTQRFSITIIFVMCCAAIQTFSRLPAAEKKSTDKKNPKKSQKIQQYVVSRNDALHESFPDLAMADNGDLVVAYQESDSHGGGPASTIATRYSTDEGKTWSKRTVVAATTNRGRDGWLNCPRIIRLQDKSLLLAVDWQPMNPPKGVKVRGWVYNHTTIWLFRSIDNGRTWSKPDKTSINIGLVPSLLQLRDGTILIGITHLNEKKDWREYQLVFRSTDNGKTWEGPITVGEHPGRQPNEGDFVELATGEVVCYMRETESSPKNGLKAISRDGGRTWSPLYGSGPWRYVGRPDVGLLSTGEVLLTSRVDLPPKGHHLGAYIETQKMALEPTPLDGPVTPGSFSKFIDNDTHATVPDWGYSGWVELKDGSIFAVQYITSEAPAHKPFIRGYRIPRSFLTLGVKK